MKTNLQLALLGLISSLAISSCVGTQSALHMSSSNFGIDVDSMPPTTEIGLSRTEVAVQPSFADGQTPSSVMSFEGKAGNGWGSGLISNFFFGTGSTFATGQAAANLTSSATGPVTPNEESTLVGLPNRPNVFKLLFTGSRRYRPFKEDEMFPLITGTKTVYGLDVNWDPATQAPRAIKAGFNRKEISYAPIIASGIRTTDPVDSTNEIKIKLPSVIAGHQMNTTVGTGAEYGHVQFLATGKAAENLGNDTKVRELLRKKIEAVIPKSGP